MATMGRRSWSRALVALVCVLAATLGGVSLARAQGGKPMVKLTTSKGEIVLELDNPRSRLVWLLTALWLFYWLPFNFENRTRKDMLAHGLANELREAGFDRVRKISLHRGVMQVLIAQCY